MGLTKHNSDGTDSPLTSIAGSATTTKYGTALMPSSAGFEGTFVDVGTKTVNYTLNLWESVKMDCTSAALTATLPPTSPSRPGSVWIENKAPAGGNSLTIAPLGVTMLAGHGGRYFWTGTVWEEHEQKKTTSALDARYGLLSGTNSFSGTGNAFTKGLGVGAGIPNYRNPFAGNVAVDGAKIDATTPIASDKVAWQMNAMFKGGFSNEAAYGATDHGFLWGLDLYALTGQTVGDLAGITDFYGAEVEAHLKTPSAALNTMRGLQVDCHIDTQAVNAVVGTMYGLYVSQAPVLPSGATVTNYYAAYLNSPTIATNNYGLYQAGIAQNYLGGPLQVSDASGSSGLVQARSLLLRNSTVPGTTQGRLTVYQGSTGDIGAIIQQFPYGGNSQDLLRFNDTGGTLLSAINNGGAFVASAAAGLVLKDTAATPHFWRLTVTSAGVLTTTDLGTTRPTT